MTVTINIDNRTILRVMAVVGLFFVGIAFLSATRNVINLLIVSAFLAMALNRPVTYLANKVGGSRGLATGISYVFVVTLIGLFLWAIIPPMVTQTREFVSELPTYVEELSQGDDGLSTFIRENNLDQEITDFVDSYTDGTSISQNSSRLFDGLERIGAGIVSVLTVLVLTFFMLIEGPGWLDKLWAAQPENRRTKHKEIGYKLYNVVSGYVNGQLLVALLAASTSLIMMLILGLPLPLPLAALVGFMGLIPLVGATIGSVLVIIIALFQGVTTAIAMAAFFLLYQQIENNFIQPYIQSRTLDVSPLLVLVAVLFGISIYGLLGAFIAIPVAGMIRILFNEYVEVRSIRKRSTRTKIADAIKP